MGFDSGGESVSFYVSEPGELRAVFKLEAGTLAPTFGTGSVQVASGGVVTGAMQAGGLQSPFPTTPQNLGCDLSGSLTERVQLTLAITCSDAAGIVYDETVTFAYQSQYDEDSSLDAIAGNYTVTFAPGINTLNIAADGTIFGMFHMTANCTVNGTVSLIDPDYALFDVTWTFSNCIDPFAFVFEGKSLSGFAMPVPNPAIFPGGYYFLLTETGTNNFQVLSINYVPT